jgi:hypothetical protein
MRVGPRLLAASLFMLALALPTSSAGGAITPTPRSLHGKHSHHLSFVVAKAHSRSLAQHVCEDIDDPDPCYAVGVRDCERLAPRKISCEVTVHFREGSYDCLWTMYVFYRQSEVSQSEGRSQC